MRQKFKWEFEQWQSNVRNRYGNGNSIHICKIHIVRKRDDSERARERHSKKEKRKRARQSLCLWVNECVLDANLRATLSDFVCFGSICYGKTPSACAIQLELELRLIFRALIYRSFSVSGDNMNIEQSYVCFSISIFIFIFHISIWSTVKMNQHNTESIQKVLDYFTLRTKSIHTIHTERDREREPHKNQQTSHPAYAIRHTFHGDYFRRKRKLNTTRICISILLFA